MTALPHLPDRTAYATNLKTQDRNIERPPINDPPCFS